MKVSWRREDRKNRPLSRIDDEDQNAVKDALRYYFMRMIDTARLQLYTLVTIAIILGGIFIFQIALFIISRL